MQTMRIGSGQTTPGSTNWQQYGTGGLYADVDTSPGDFSAVPNYISSVGGDSSHWELIGGSAIYNPTAKNFRIYIRFPDGRAVTPAFANANRWNINWIGVQLFPG